MSATSSVTNEGVNPKTVSTVSTSFEELFEKGRTEFDVDKKQQVYGQAYVTLHAKILESKNSPEHMRSLFTLLHAYAAETYYGKELPNDPEDEEWGMRRCARLLELSFCLQLRQLDLATIEYDVTPFKTMDSLIDSLEVQKSQKGKFFDAVKELNADPDVLVKAASEKGLRGIMSQTITRLSYAYQNIDALTKPGSLAFHMRMNDFTQKLIGKETPEAKKALVDFNYNRASFKVDLTDPDNIQAKIDCYNPVREEVLVIFADDILTRDSLLAQIKNRQAQFTSKLQKPTALAVTEALLEEAFALRQPIVGKFATDQQNYDQEKLLCNVRCGLISCNLRKMPLEPAHLEKAQEHAQALKAFLVKAKTRSDFNGYNGDYQKLIDKVDAATKTTV